MWLISVVFSVVQLQKLQAVICEKDVRFQEQIQKHEEELMTVTARSQNDGELQQVQRSCQTFINSLIYSLRVDPFNNYSCVFIYFITY